MALLIRDSITAAEREVIEQGLSTESARVEVRNRIDHNGNISKANSLNTLLKSMTIISHFASAERHNYQTKDPSAPTEYITQLSISVRLFNRFCSLR